MQRINIPGVGIVQFPDSMSDEQIDQAIQRDILPSMRGATRVAPTMPMDAGRPTSQPSTAEQAGRSGLQRNIFDPVERGFQNLMIGAAATRALSPDSLLGLDPEEAAAAISRRQRRLAEIPRTEASQRAFREAEEAESIPGAVGRLASSSAALGDIGLESLGTNPLAAPVGALANVTPVPVLRQAIGALAGALGFPTEYLTSVSNGVMEAAQSRGVDVRDPRQLSALLREINANPELRGDIRSDALVRAGIISAADAAAGYGAGRVVTRGVVGRVGGGAGIEAAGGGLGEAGAQLATEGRITSPAEIAAEIIGGAGMGALGNIRQSPTPGQDPALQAAIEQIVRARGGAQPAPGTIELPGGEPPIEPAAEVPVAEPAAAPAVVRQPDLLAQPEQPARPEVAPPVAAAPEALPAAPAPAETAAPRDLLAGVGAPAPAPVAPQAETFNIPVGRQFAVSTPDGSMSVDVVPEVVDLFSLNPATGALQNRMIDNPANQATINNIANAPDFTRLGTSPYSDRGAPIIGPDNVIEIGNHRVEGLKRAAENNPQAYQGYVRALNEAGYDTSGMQFPVLVRRRVGELDPAKRQDFTRLSNTEANQSLSDLELAKQDASRLTPELLSKFDGEVSGGVRAAKNLPFVRDFLSQITTPSERTRLISPEGGISDALADRLERALFASAYNDIALIKRAVETGDDDTKSITGGMIEATGAMQELRRGIDSGRIRPEFDIVQSLVKAADRIRAGKANQLTPADILATEDMLNPIPGIERELIKLLSNDSMNKIASKSAIGKRLKAFVEEAKTQTTDQDLVGGERRITPEEAAVTARNPGQASMFSARATDAGVAAEAPAVKAKRERAQEKARRTVNKFLDDLRSRGRQARIFAGDLDRLLRDRTMTAEQIYRGFMIADTLAKTIPARADYRLKFVQDLVVDNEKAARASGAKVGDRAQGRVVYPEEGSAGLIELSLAKDMLPYLNETAAHEGFHVLQTYFAEYDKAFADRINKSFKEDMKISDLEPSIKRRLQALKPPGSKVSYYDSLVQGLGDKPLSVKEAQAYAFGSLVDASMRGKPTAGILPPFQRFVLFAKEFLAKLKSALNKDGFESAADLLLSAQRRGARMTQAAPTAEGAAYSGRTLPPTIEVDGVTRPTTNSEGRQIHPTAEGVRNFWRWFGDSKVVDAEGRPQVVYHGTSKDKDFASFNVPKRGAWFAADPAEASSYANENDSRAVKYDWNTRQFRDVNTAARVIPVYLSIKNPVDLTQGQKDRLSGKTGEENYARVQGDVFSELRAAGADGVQAAPGVWVALKDPTQVKSAIGNLGTFKPTDKRTQYSARRVTDKDPVLEEAAKGVRAGAVTREEYEALVNERKPVNPYAYVPEPATEAEITSALERTDPRKVPLVGKASERLKEGDEVGLRLDIPAYSKQNTWVVSVHEPKGQGFYAGTPIGYEPTAVATDVKLGVVEGGAMKIAAGDIDKTTIAVMRGKWKPATPEQAKARADAAMNDPNWIQVGMDPRRHQYFYDRNSMEPVVAADEVIQVGPLVLAKNPTYANKAAYQYSARRVPDQYAARATGQVAGLPAFGQRVNPQTPSGTQQAELNVQYDVVSRALSKRLGRFISPAKIESFFMKFQDKMLPVGRMIDDVRAAGGNVAVAMDAYLKEDLMQGKVAALLEWRKKNLYDPLVNAIADSGLSIQDFENFLYARHAPERNRYIASINPDMPDGGSGLTNKQAEEMMKEFQQQGKTAKLTELAKMFDKIIEDTNRVRVEAGLTPDFSQMTMTEDGRLLPNWEFYAPLRNFVQESVDGSETVKEFRPKTGKALGARGREDRRVTGRERLAGDILAHAMMQNTQAVIRSEQNKVGQSFLALIRANPEQTKDLAQVISSAPLRTTIVNGVVKTMPDPFYKNDPDVLVVKENGKEIAIRIFDDNVARAMTGASALSPASKNILVQGMATVNRFLAKVNTAYNPEFLITNFARDLQTFGINVKQFDIDGLTRDVMGDLKGSLSGIRDVTRGTNNNPEMARYFQRFRELGGTTDMYGFADIETRIAEINETMNKVGTEAKSWKEMAQKATGPVIKLLEDYNTIVENGVRTALFKNLVERGFNEEKAAQAAKNITVNFSKGGENRVLMNALYLFYNASLQGSMAMMNAIGRSPKVRKIVAGVVVAGVLQDVINSMLSDVDDDEEKVYDKIPDHVLKRSFVMMDPFQITDRGYFSFPMPYGFNAFFNMGREMSKTARGATSPMKAAGSIVGTFVDSFNPIGGSESILNFIAPTILDPVVDIVENRDFAGRPIVPERGGFGPQVPESQKYWNNTFAPYVSISNFLNEVTGGTRVIPGAVDISPNIIQYAVNYVTGGVGKFVERTYNTVTGTIPDALRGDLQEVDVKGVPLLRSLYGNVTTRSDTERYMERMEEVLRVRQEIRDAGQYGQTERIDAAMRRYPGQVEIMEAFNRISRERAQLSQQINAINRNPNIDADSKKEIIKLLRDQQNALVGVANQLYNQSVERRQ